MRRSDCPRHVFIKDSFYTVLFKRNLADFIGIKSVIGYCDGEKQIIFIQIGLSAEVLFATFMHEVMHSIEFEYNIKIPHKLIYKMDAPLAKFLADNCDMAWDRSAFERTADAAKLRPGRSKNRKRAWSSTHSQTTCRRSR